MVLNRDIVGQFVDAAAQDPIRADRLLGGHPNLRSAIWLGESLLRFLAIENYAEGVRYLAQRGWNVNDRKTSREIKDSGLFLKRR